MFIDTLTKGKNKLMSPSVCRTPDLWLVSDRQMVKQFLTRWIINVWRLLFIGTLLGKKKRRTLFCIYCLFYLILLTTSFYPLWQCLSAAAAPPVMRLNTLPAVISCRQPLMWVELHMNEKQSDTCFILKRYDYCFFIYI